MNKYDELRKTHKKFIYRDYEITENGFSFYFSIDEHEFVPRWTFDADNAGFSANPALLRELVFNLGMVELVSYWKCACPPVVEVRCGGLDAWRLKWWKKLYLNGLGEFFYRNGITPGEDFMTITAKRRVEKIPLPENDAGLKGCLIPVGGGKDSAVTLELLGETREENLCYIIGDIRRAYYSAKTAGYPDSAIIKVNRSVSPALLELNKKGYLNGHTPFSAIVAFSSLIFAYATGRRYVVLSNESGANEGNVLNTGINHQYSKSVEFERDFRDYANLIGPRVLPEYFSLLRPWNELRITERFTRYPKYFPVFQSCNAGTKTNTWCRKCAKCLYVYIMLAAWLDDGVLINIFGENLLDNADFARTLAALADPAFDKPFECVGTRDEVNSALGMALERRRAAPPALLRVYADKIKPPRSDPGDFFDENNFVPKEFLKLLK
ncbi:MAG: hypothetical protein LBI38_01870 [Oscillospiraceae bacterium]|jgi:hypothetical protein|nr:hypothetical protein [Oscillospiraceae bacterium]